MRKSAKPQLGSCAHAASTCARVASGCGQRGAAHAYTQTKTMRTGHTQHKRPAQKPKPRLRQTATPAARRPPLPTTPPARPRLDPKLETHTADPRAPWVPVPAKTPCRTPDQSETCFRVSDSFFESQIQIFGISDSFFESQIRLNLRFIFLNLRFA